MKRKLGTILVVDDERNTREAIASFLCQEFDVTVAEDGARALNVLRKRDFDLILTDMKMPGADGMDILRECRQKNPRAKCIILTAYGSIDSAVKAVKEGAFDFLEKPLNLDILDVVVKRAVEASRLEAENFALKKQLRREFGVENMIGSSTQLRNLVEMIKLVAPSKSTVMIGGESGTGKELVAEAIHALSQRSGPFVPVHCAALPSNLLESELFGHEKGAFTGALERKKGRFEIADKGTLFLDEIGEIDMTTQIKLLRALETRSFELVGGTERIVSDARVLAATNKDLEKLVAEGKFREDLFYRLNVITIHVPPLRERKEDIPLLVKHFIEQFSKENSKTIDGMSDEALDAIIEYSWPGNVRELRNCIERMVVLSRKGYLDLGSVPANIRQNARDNLSKKTPAADTCNIHENEKYLVAKALEETAGNISKAAEILGISRRTLHRKLKILDLKVEKGA